MHDDLAVPLDSQTPLAATVSVTRAPLLTIPFLLCAAANFLQSLSLHLYLHLPGFLQTLGAGVVQIGILFGLTAAVAIAARPIIGRQIDVHGRRPSILIGGALNVMFCGLYLTIASMGPWVYAVRFAHGIAQAILFTAFFTPLPISCHPNVAPRGSHCSACPVCCPLVWLGSSVTRFSSELTTQRYFYAR